MITRVSQLRIPPKKADRAEELVRDDLAPAVLGQPGAIAGHWMVDAASGEVLTAVQWADDEAMLAAGAALAGVRDRVVGELRAAPLSLQVHDLVGASVTEALTLDRPAWSHVVVLDGAGPRDDTAALFRIVADELDGMRGHLGVTWSADFAAGHTLCLATWRTRHDAEQASEASAGVWAEVVRTLSVRLASSTLRRTVGSTPAEHVIDLTGFDRTAALRDG